MKRILGFIAVALLAILGTGLSLMDRRLEMIGFVGIGLLFAGFGFVWLTRMEPGLCFITVALLGVGIAGHFVNDMLGTVGLLGLILWIGGLSLFRVFQGAREALREAKRLHAEERKRLFQAHIQSHSCPICGYSLVGNVSGTCPECGTTMRDLLQ